MDLARGAAAQRCFTLTIALLKRKISFLIALFKNEMTRNDLAKCKSYTLEQTLYDIGYEFDNTNGIIDENQCLETCNLKLKYIHNNEKNLRSHELPQCVSYLLINRNALKRMN